MRGKGVRATLRINYRGRKGVCGAVMQRSPRDESLRPEHDSKAVDWTAYPEKEGGILTEEESSFESSHERARVDAPGDHSLTFVAKQRLAVVLIASPGAHGFY
jgi:hypothetical protein